jgi:hypothetical protein
MTLEPSGFPLYGLASAKVVRERVKECSLDSCWAGQRTAPGAC